MSEKKRFELLDETIFDNQKQAEDGGRVTYWVVAYQQRQELVDLLNELNEENRKLRQERERWKTLYELKDKEVTARVDALNKVCEYYTSEVLFKSDTDPNKAVKEVINEILNTEVENDE